MIKGVHHVAIAVSNLDEALKVYEQVLGAKPVRIEPVPDQGVRAALIPIGEEGEIELIEPTNPEGGVARFIEKRGEAIHHICFQVDDIEKELAALAAKGIELIDKTPRKGVPGRIAFLHPRSARGILMELVQPYAEGESRC
jgi:methylmalonyl-CoA epimerase